MTIENTVSSDFRYAFVDCLERFRLPPIRCVVIGSESKTTKIDHIFYVSFQSCTHMCFIFQFKLKTHYEKSDPKDFEL